MIYVILADTYYSNPGYGTSEINSDIDKAYEFWTQVVVDQNPRIPFHEKGDLRNLANAAYSNCKTLWPFWDDESETLCFWSYLRDWADQYTTDADILAILEIAQDTSADVADPPDSIPNQIDDIISGEQKIQIPWWIYAGMGLAVYGVLK